MKSLLLICFMLGCIAGTSHAQAFRKGSLLVSISEGATYANYNTSNPGNDVIRENTTTGDRDPITVEYGLTRHWGVGLNFGGDIFTVNPSNFYNFRTDGKDVKVITSEATADVHYHFWVTKKVDLSLVGSFGVAGVTIEGDAGDAHYKYNATGSIARGGMEARYYLLKRLNALAMVTAFSSRCSTRDVKDNTFGNNIATSISGIAWEIGLGYRILR